MPLHSNLAQYSEIAAGDQQFQLQNARLLRVSLTHGPVQAAAGTMVAYQGDVTFENKGSGGIGKMLKKAATGEGTKLMHIGGTGEVFLADEAQQVQVMYLENDQISANGKNVLAFSSSIEWDINRVSSGVAGMMAGGLFNMTLRGSGYVALKTDGDPVMLDVAQAPTFGDPSAVVMWTSGVEMNVKTDTTGGLKSLARGGSGETFQLAFTGQGHVLVQPSEGPRVVVQG